MSKQLSDTPVKPDEQITSSTTTTGSLPAFKKKEPAVFWPWLGGLLVVGLVIVGIVTLSVWNWLNNIQRGIGANTPSSSVSTVNVGRSTLYADLNITWNDVQYTTSFSDDPIHAGPATARVGLKVTNSTSNTIVIAYYDVVRLLVPGQQPIVPTNLNLSAAPQKGSTQTGWIDFPVGKNLKLESLKLQFGNAATSELLPTIPVTGSYNPNQYNSQTAHPSLNVYYYFQGWHIPAYTINYHLASVEIRYAYNGVETKAGQQYYVLNFTVDNPNGVTVSPGLGFDYLRLALNGGNRPPIDNSLPASFKANAHGVAGHVVFQAPANLHSLNVVFLHQAVPGGDTYPISW
jgi:hypothetical protein